MWVVESIKFTLGAYLLIHCGVLNHLFVTCEFENSWTFYLEQPCCSSGSGHHLRHHKDHVREFSCGMMYYRTFFLDSKRDTLYVGAMDRVFRLNLSNISQTHCEVSSIATIPPPLTSQPNPNQNLFL